MVKGARVLALAVVAAAAACGVPETGSLVGPPGDGPSGRDGGGSADPDGGLDPDGAIDAPPDAPDPTRPDGGIGDPDLAMLCGGRAPETLEDWETCYRQRECEREVACITLNTYRDAADCVASWDDIDGGQRAADRLVRQRAVEMGRASINVPAFTQCLGLISTTRCIDPFWDEACATRFTGTVADHGSCFADTECASPGAICDAACGEACCAGTCEPAQGVGQTCNDAMPCQPGLQCNGSTCITGDLGTACTSVLQCDFDYWCDTRAHRCKAKFAADASCTDILQCGGSYSCIGLSITNSTPGNCRSNSHPGDPCDDTCFGNLFCDRTKMCRSLPVLGEGCSSLIPCAGTNTICNSGLCVVRDDVGVTCGNRSCLPNLFCTAELGDMKPVCAARGGTGASCASPDHCDSHLCSGTPSQHGVCLAWRETCP
ncbi:MAG: hypothetical protein ABIY55_25030 [Kofleriaceae bacterium]